MGGREREVLGFEKEGKMVRVLEEVRQKCCRFLEKEEKIMESFQES